MDADESNDQNGSCENKRKLTNGTYLVILAASFLLTGIINPPAEAHSPAEQVASVLGAGLALAIIPLGVAAFLSKIGAYISLTALAALTFYGSVSESSKSQAFTYSHEGCEFKVDFPSEPFRETIHVPSIGDYQQLIWGNPDPDKASFLRAECIKSSVSKLDKENAKEFVMRSLKEYADQEGLNNVSYQYKYESTVHIGKLRGYKKVGEIRVVYETYWHFGAHSVLAVAGGGAAEFYPDSNVSACFSSVKRVN